MFLFFKTNVWVKNCFVYFFSLGKNIIFKINIDQLRINTFININMNFFVSNIFKTAIKSNPLFQSRSIVTCYIRPPAINSLLYKNSSIVNSQPFQLNINRFMNRNARMPKRVIILFLIHYQVN